MQARLISSYEIMLDFYGCILKDKKTGELARSEFWEERYKFLDNSSHNYLRITRILKCLGLTGLEHMKKQFIKHYLYEVLEEKHMQNVCESLFKFWLPTLRNETELEEMENYAESLTGKKVTRKWYNKEKRTWANVCYPDTKKNVNYPEGKTFYNRDDDNFDINPNDLIDIEPPRYKYYSFRYNKK
jgi:hypothetical protein